MNCIKKMCLLLSFIFIAFSAHATDTPKTPSATVSVDITVLGAAPGIRGLSKGVLVFQGKQYPFALSGINLPKNAMGAGKLTATGNVFDLSDPSKFPGTFMRLGGGLGLVKDGSGLYKNSNGVTMDLEGLSNTEILINPKGSVIKFIK